MAADTTFALKLEMDMDERRYDAAVTDFVRKAYEDVASVAVRTHEGTRFAENTIVCVVEGSAPGDEGLQPWLEGRISTLNGAIASAREHARQQGSAGVDWSWAKVVADGGIFVNVHTDGESQLPADAAAMVCEARANARDGVFPPTAKCAFIPARASYEGQLAEVLASLELKNSEAYAADNSINESAHVAAVEALENASVISEELHDLARADAEGAKLDALKEDLVQLAGEEAREKVAPVVPPAFDVDYSTWEIFMADGSSALYDAAGKALR